MWRLRRAGASGVTRTPDLLITNQLLYRLSYTSTPIWDSAPHRTLFFSLPQNRPFKKDILTNSRRPHHYEWCALPLSHSSGLNCESGDRLITSALLISCSTSWATSASVIFLSGLIPCNPVDLSVKSLRRRPKTGPKDWTGNMIAHFPFSVNMNSCGILPSWMFSRIFSWYCGWHIRAIINKSSQPFKKWTWHGWFVVLNWCRFKG